MWESGVNYQPVNVKVQAPSINQQKASKWSANRKITLRGKWQAYCHPPKTEKIYLKQEQPKRSRKNPNICRNMLSLFRPAKVNFKPFGRGETTAEKNRNQLLWTDYNIVNIWQYEIRLQFCLEQNIWVFFCLCHWWSWGCFFCLVVFPVN